MIYQQNIEQILATIKVMQVQHENGYHISTSDYNDFNSAVNDVNALWHEVAKEFNRVQE
jgi:hypothetical protein